jgi:integrase
MSYEIRFYLEQRKDRVNDVPIRFSFNFGGQRFMSTTGIKADVKQWSKSKQQILSGATNSEAKNEALKTIRNQLERIYLDATNEGKAVTPDYMKEAFRKKGEPLTFFDYYNEFTQTAGTLNAWSLSTYQKFKTLKIHLQNFEEVENYKLEFSKVNRDFYQKLFMYFVGIGHRNSTIKKTFKNVNWFFGWCIKSKKINISGYKDFEIKDRVQSTQGNPENIVFLRPDEFLMLFEANIPDLRLSRVRDIFVFMCATGFRFSDYDQFSKEMIMNDIIKITIQKTSDPLEIPLNIFSKSILEKYNYNLPKISNPKLNLYLKELAKLLLLNRLVTKVYIKAGETKREQSELWELITTHTGRKTFASLAVFLDFNPEMIMRFTGHKTYEMLKVYTGINEEQKRATMAQFTPENLKNKIAK